MNLLIEQKDPLERFSHGTGLGDLFMRCVVCTNLIIEILTRVFYFQNPNSCVFDKFSKMRNSRNLECPRLRVTYFFRLIIRQQVRTCHRGMRFVEKRRCRMVHGYARGSMN